MAMERKYIMNTETDQTQLQTAYHFCSPIYTIERPDFLEAVNTVSEEYFTNKEKKIDEIYPVNMSENYYDDPRVADFAEFVGMSAWNILAGQGYSMNDKILRFTEMWTQEHHKHSAMDQHTHGYGSQIVGFYFLEVPENASRVVFHDPRIAKTMIDLPQDDVSKATIASSMINFEPKPGLLIFANAWLAHSFTRHANEKPIKFVHFNLNVQQGDAINQCKPLPPVEVI
jgi:uncharacterized protein (TIGR02466 family)